MTRLVDCWSVLLAPVNFPNFAMSTVISEASAEGVCLNFGLELAFISYVLKIYGLLVRSTRPGSCRCNRRKTLGNWPKLGEAQTLL